MNSREQDNRSIVGFARGDARRPPRYAVQTDAGELVDVLKPDPPPPCDAEEDTLP